MWILRKEVADLEISLRGMTALRGSLAVMADSGVECPNSVHTVLMIRNEFPSVSTPSNEFIRGGAKIILGAGMLSAVKVKRAAHRNGCTQLLRNFPKKEKDG
ncbi:MAG: hypothetical protein ACTSXX_05835 [Candidatus Baldrarchaeia archaeon]